MSFIARRFWWLFALCVAAAALVLLLMPAEKTLGQVIKIVYLHGALSRAGMLGFILSGALGLTYLITRRQPLVRWSQALIWSGLLFWCVHFLVSMPATRLTWGPWIAWGEPRVTMTLQIAAAGLALILVSLLVQNAYFTAAANGLFGLAFIFMAERTGVLRHPLDPIGASPSAALRLIYAVLLVPVIAAMLLLAWRWSRPPTTAPEVQPARASGGAE